MLTSTPKASLRYLLHLAPAMARVALRGLFGTNRHAVAVLLRQWIVRAWRWLPDLIRARREGVPMPRVLQLVDDVACGAGCSHCVFASFRARGRALSRDDLAGILDQAAEMGVGWVYMLGSDPFYRPDAALLLDLLAARRSIVFYLFTEGRRFDFALLDRVARAGNIVPVLNVDGLREATERRKGAGSWDALESLADRLRARRLPWFVSTMVSRENLDEVTSRPFVDWLGRRGAWVLAYVPYSPVDPRAEAGIVLTRADRDLLFSRSLALNRGRWRPAVLDLVGIEEKLTSCPSALHSMTVFFDGTAAPCVALPFGSRDANVLRRPLRDVFLHDPLHQAIRAFHADHGNARCMVFSDPTFVRGWLDEHGDEMVVLSPAMVEAAVTGPAGWPEAGEEADDGVDPACPATSTSTAGGTA